MTDTTSTRPQMGDCQKHDFVYAASVEDYPHANYDHSFMQARFRRCSACGLEEFRDWAVRASLPQPTAGSTAHDEGHPHLISGEFQSDKYPTTPRGKVPLSVKDRTAQDLLWTYAQRRRVVDGEFANDLELALTKHGFVPSTPAQSGLVEAHLQVLCYWRDRLAEYHTPKYPTADKTSIGYIAWFIDHAIERARELEISKLGRWTGFIQAGLAHHGYLNLDEERQRTRLIFSAAAPSQPAPVAAPSGWKFEDHENGVVYVRAPSGKHVAIGYMAPGHKDCTDILRELIIAHLQAASSPQPDRESEREIDFETLAVEALHAWNNIPNTGFFSWPKDFPEGSRDGWRRVVRAIAGSSSGRTAHFDCANGGSNPPPASTSIPDPSP